MTDKMTMDALNVVRNHLAAADSDMLRDLVQLVVERLMSAEADALCGAAWGERSDGRVNRRNGYRHRRWDTRVGSINVAIPKLREGSYFPSWLLEPRRRSEQALIGVIAEAYVRGVSTRRVEGLVQQLGIEGISKSQVSEISKGLDEQVQAFLERPLDAAAYPYLWIDAVMMKSRENGRIANVAVAIATGVNADGYREVLGLDVFTTEDGAAWTQFLRGLVARGLGNVRVTRRLERQDRADLNAGIAGA